MKTLIKSSELEILAKKYVWWENSAWAYGHPEVFLANVMNLGTWEDMQLARQIVGEEALKQALQEAPPGYFNYRSWDYWHLKLGISPIPPLPQRKFA